MYMCLFFFQAEDGIRDIGVTGVQTCALPIFVWADEPTGDLDSTTADEVMDLMERLNREKGLTFVIVTHDIGVGRRAHRIVRMLDGQIVEEQYPAHAAEIARR